MPVKKSYKQINRQGWNSLARQGCESSKPYGPEQFSHARRWLDSRDWIPWNQIKSVLCLAASGGQQAPLFASLGYKVTSVDLSTEQLQLDQDVARQNGFEIECVEADMLNLSQLYGRKFDLVYQAISACYVPEVRLLYQQVFRVLRRGGFYWVEHWNPYHVQLPEAGAWNGHAYLIARPQQPGKPVPWTGWSAHEESPSATCWHFIHSLDDLIGGLCEAGFMVIRFAETRRGDITAEPGSHQHLAAYLPPFFALFARRKFGHLSKKTVR
jgi:SAM-dependent methyltransferase